MLTGLVGSLGVWVAGAIAVALAAFGLFKTGHAVGSATATAKAAQDNAVANEASAQVVADARVETLKGASDVEAKVANLDSAGVADELQQYSRPAADTSAAVQTGDSKAD